MPTIDFSELVNDPDIGQCFTIQRTAGQWKAGVWVLSQPNSIPAYGIIGVADDEALSQVPEGDRVTGAIQVITQQELYRTSEKAGLISDKICWQGSTYGVIHVGPWKHLGFYSAILSRLDGD